MRSPRNRLEGPLDGALHLLDRQLLDAAGRLLGKVDDVELAERPDGLVVASLLTGPAALLPRIGGGRSETVLHRWQALRPSEPGRTWPWRIEMSAVEHLDNAVHLRMPRDGAIRRDRPAEHRLSELTGMDVRTPEGRYGRVLDARFSPDDRGTLLLTSLVVGRGRPGSLLGYDRRGDQGPAVVRGLVRRLHRHSALVAAETARIDWSVGIVSVEVSPADAPGHPFD